MNALALSGAVAAADAQTPPTTRVIPAEIAADRHIQPDEPVESGAMDAEDA